MKKSFKLPHPDVLLKMDEEQLDKLADKIYDYREDLLDELSYAQFIWNEIFFRIIDLKDTKKAKK